LSFNLLLQIFSNLPYTTLSSLAEKELDVSTSSSKGEEGDVWLGRILFYGALLRSGHMQNASKNVKTEVIGALLEASTKKSYLPAIAAPFLVHVINSCNEDQFSKFLWPVLKTSLAKEWKDQNQHSLFLLIHLYNRY
jgi:hypothetical protein